MSAGRKRCLTIAVVAFAGASIAISAEQPSGARIAAEGVYTGEQAERGRDVYQEHCSYCHHDDLLGGGEDIQVVPPALIGAEFRNRWYGESVGEMLRVVTDTMPWRTASLAPQDYADVVAYILMENGYSVGSTELPADPAPLDDILITEAR